ncbi:MAG: hypothetical protein QXO19_02795 [Candidatus Aenigmatarchaeota archaeon]
MKNKIINSLTMIFLFIILIFLLINFELFGSILFFIFSLAIIILFFILFLVFIGSYLALYRALLIKLGYLKIISIEVKKGFYDFKKQIKTENIKLENKKIFSKINCPSAYPIIKKIISSDFKENFVITLDFLIDEISNEKIINYISKRFNHLYKISIKPSDEMSQDYLKYKINFSNLNEKIEKELFDLFTYNFFLKYMPKIEIYDKKKKLITECFKDKKKIIFEIEYWNCKHSYTELSNIIKI